MFNEWFAGSDSKEFAISVEGIQTNDVWNIVFLVLLTHNPKFSYCYSYNGYDESSPLIQFDFTIFQILFLKVLKDFESDECLGYALRKLINLKNLEILAGTEQPASRKAMFLQLLEHHLTDNRNLKFIIWILMRSELKKNKIREFEDGKMIREVDFNLTLDQVESTYFSDSEMISFGNSLIDNDENKLNMASEKYIVDSSSSASQKILYKTQMNIQKNLSEVFEVTDNEQESDRKLDLKRGSFHLFAENQSRSPSNPLTNRSSRSNTGSEYRRKKG